MNVQHPRKDTAVGRDKTLSYLFRAFGVFRG
jgi:hypothetical protein